MEARFSQIPNYLEASTPKGLVSLCLKNNLRLGMYISYQIIFDGKKWFAWYYEDVKDMIMSESPKNKK